MATPVVGRDEVIALLASYGNRTPAEVGEHIDSLELAWLLHALTERYGLTEDLTDDQLIQMSTVDGVVAVVAAELAGATR